jgi:hypothetical protein
LTNACQRSEQDPTRLQDSIKALQRRAEIIDELERLSADDTIESVRWQSPITAQIGNDCCLWVAFFDVKYVGAADSLLAKLFRVAIISYLKDTSSNIRQEFPQELFYVVTIDAGSPVETKFLADRGNPP